MGQQAPDFLAIGCITLDKVSTGYTLGGTAVYAAITARNLGHSVAILTSGAPPEVQDLRDRGICVYSIPSASTTIFENMYQGGHRTQYLRSVADVIHPADLPAAWKGAATVHLGPVAQEVDPLFSTSFEHSLVGVTPQGWMRAWDETGRVRFHPWDTARQLLDHVDVLVFSEQDVNGETQLVEQYAAMAKLAVVTRGDQGCDLMIDGTLHRLPAYPTQEVDPTGAGDVFAAAFLIRMEEHGDPFDAANFANCVASFAVEAPGISGIPTRAQVADRFRSR